LLTPFLVSLAVLALPSRAANQTVTASDFQFTPAIVTVTQGETVTWNNTGGFHNVRFDDGSYTQPSPAQNAPWTVFRTFNTPGTFRYYCEIHGGPGGIGMSGTVTVTAPGGAPPPPAPKPAPTADSRAPIVKLAGPARQRIRKRAVLVFAKVDEASTVTATGSVAVPGASKVLRLKKVTKKLAPNVKTKLALKLSRKAATTAARALKRRTQLTARVVVTAKDSAGNTRSAKRKIKLKA
jgi:plastocyanin